MKSTPEITFLRVEKPSKDLVRFLYQHFAFSDDSLLADYSKLYCKLKSTNKIRFNIIIVMVGKRVVAWGIATENLAKRRKSCSYTDLFESGDILIMLYVDAAHRKMGIASNVFHRLMKENRYQRPIVIGHDKASHWFFNKMQTFYKKRKITIIDWR